MKIRVKTTKLRSVAAWQVRAHAGGNAATTRVSLRETETNPRALREAKAAMRAKVAHMIHRPACGRCGHRAEAR